MFKLTAHEHQAFVTQFQQLCTQATQTRSPGGIPELGGSAARIFFMRSSLQPMDLASIWELADVSKTGNLNFGEFCAAMKLIRCKVQGQVIPQTLPQELLDFVTANPVIGSSQSALNPAVDRSKHLSGGATLQGNRRSLAHSNMILPTATGPANMSAFSTSSRNMLPHNSVSNTQRFNSSTIAAAGQPIRPTFTGLPSNTTSSTSMFPTSFGDTTRPITNGNPTRCHQSQQLQPSFTGVAAMRPTTKASYPQLAPTSTGIPTPKLHHTMSTQNQMSSVPGRADDELWMPSKPAQQRFSQIFRTLDKGNTGYISGNQARDQMVLSKLDKTVLAQVWGLADHDRDGRFSEVEFVMAMWMCLQRAQKTHSLPLAIPQKFWTSLQQFIDVSKPPPANGSSLFANSNGPRTVSSASSTAPISIGSSAVSQPLSINTMGSASNRVPGGGFAAKSPPKQMIPTGLSSGLGISPGKGRLSSVDSASSGEKGNKSAFHENERRRANMARGEAELEKRRQALRETQRKEEERLESERRIRQEKEEASREAEAKRKEAELEAVRERQRRQEAEMETVRRKAAQQREQARRALAKKRRNEWEIQRREQVFIEKRKLKEEIRNLQARNQQIDIEIESSRDRHGQLKQRSNDLEGRRQAEEHEVRQSENSLAVAMREIQDKQDEITRLKLDCQRYAEETSCLDRELAELDLKNQEMPNLAGQISQREKELGQCDTRFKEVNQQNAANSSTIQTLTSKVADVREKFEKLRLAKDGLKTKQQDAVRDLQAMRISNMTPVNAVEKPAAESTGAAMFGFGEESGPAANGPSPFDTAEVGKSTAQKPSQEANSTISNPWKGFDDDPAPAEPPSSTNTTTAKFGEDPWAAAAATTTSKPNGSNFDDPFGSGSQAFGNSDPFGGSAFSNTAQEPSGFGSQDPFAKTQPADTAFSQQQSASDPFGSGTGPAAVNGADPFAATSAQPQDPFAAGQAAVDPFAENQAADPFAASEDPFGSGNDPFATDPFANDPFPSSEAKPAAAEAVAGEISPPVQQTQGPTFRCLYEFEARNADELSLQIGDIVMLNSSGPTPDPGWLIGARINEPTRFGMFPENYVEPCDVTSPAAQTVEDPAATGAIGSAFSAFKRPETSPEPGKGTQYNPPKAVLVKHKFASQKPRDLSLNQGDTMMVEEQHNDWYYGWNSSDSFNKGWFPANFVEDTSQASPEVSRAMTLGPTSQHLSPEKASKDRSKSPVKRPAPKPPGSKDKSAIQTTPYIAAYAYAGNEPSDLTFQAGQVILVERMDGDWWVGRIGDKRGNFPANYVTPESEWNQSNGTSPAPTGSAFEEYTVTAVYTYEGDTKEDLRFEAGEKITVVGKVDEFWLQGKNSKNEVGIFPSTYTDAKS